MDRRNALKNIIGITTCAAGATLVPSFSAEAAPAYQPGTRLAYAKLVPMDVAKIAFREDVRKFGCMYQVFHALIEALSLSDSADAAKFAEIQTGLAVYGGGGVLGQGTVCGNNNATGMLYKMISVNGAAPKTLANISAYYEQTPLPLNDAAFLEAMGVDADTFAAKVGQKTVAKSLLCHASLTRWADANKMDTSDKGMRCQLLSASIAYKVAEMLNAELEQSDLSVFPGKTSATSSCASCHNTGSKDAGNGSYGPSVMAGMECDTCHGND